MMISEATFQLHSDDDPDMVIAQFRAPPTFKSPETRERYDGWARGEPRLRETGEIIDENHVANRREHGNPAGCIDAGGRG